MNREEYFSKNRDLVTLDRTRMSIPFQHRTAFNTGDIVPVFATPVLPGDEIPKNKLSYLLRLFTPLNQIYSNMYIDFYAFFVPHRLVWTHWTNFLGENDTTAWTETTSYTLPKSNYQPIDLDDSYCDFGNYLGAQIIYGSGGTPQAAPLVDLYRRDYLCIYNNWFRDENVIAPILYSVGDNIESTPVFTFSSKLLKAAKMHDYFTSCVPTPMKGTPPTIGDDLLVDSDTNLHTMVQGVKFGDGSLAAITGATFGTDSSGLLKGYVGAPSSGSTTAFSSNLIARMNITIEDIRNAAVVTHVMEKLAKTGSRYPEFLKGIWGVTSSDARLQIPEYLAGKRYPIRISEVVSSADTVSSGSGSYLGETGAYCKDGRAEEFFHAAFTEYGMLWVVATVRIEQTYFQGTSRHLTDSEFFDLPLPQTQHIGLTPRYKDEIFTTYTNFGDKTKIFGYGPAWDHYRHFPYLATSIMKPSATYGLASYDASEIYASEPSLNKAFIEQPASGLDRCIAVPSTSRAAFQWFGEFRLDMDWVRPISFDSDPGLMRI